MLVSYKVYEMVSKRIKYMILCVNILKHTIYCDKYALSRAFFIE